MTRPLSSDTQILGDVRTFETTRWNLVRAARDIKALGALIRIYWKPLYFFVRRQGYDNEAAKDIVQEFLSMLIERDTILRADPARGKFRTFLIAALKNFIRDRAKAAACRKRGGESVVFSLDFVSGEREYLRQVPGGETPEATLNRAWARSLLEQSISEIKGHPAHLEAFKSWLADEDFKTISLKTELSEPAAKSAVHRLRGELRRIVTDHIRETVSSEEELKEELSEFVSLFPASVAGRCRS